MTFRSVAWLVAALVPGITYAGTFVSTSGSGTFTAQYPRCHRPFLSTPSGPMGNSSEVVTSIAMAAGAGRLVCLKLYPNCGVLASKAAFITNSAVAGTQCEVGFYTEGGVKLTSTGPFDCSAAVTTYDKALVPILEISPTTVYYFCFSTSGTTQTMFSYNTKTLHNTADPLYLSKSATAVALFNDNCTGAGAPYGCCTALDTGTCTGFPTSFTPTATTAFAIPETLFH